MGQPVVQWQILAQDPDRLVQFYRDLFDWSVNSDNPLGYRQIDTKSDQGINGGIWPAPPQGHAMVSLYVEVGDIPGFIEKAAKLGGGTVIPHQVLPGGDEMAVIRDPEGLAIGLVKPAKSQEH